MEMSKSQDKGKTEDIQIILIYTIRGHSEKAMMRRGVGHLQARSSEAFGLPKLKKTAEPDKRLNKRNDRREGKFSRE
jgi:hypothetical protein